MLFSTMAMIKYSYQKQLREERACFSLFQVTIMKQKLGQEFKQERKAENTGKGRSQAQAHPALLYTPEFRLREWHRPQ